LKILKYQDKRKFRFRGSIKYDEKNTKEPYLLEKGEFVSGNIIIKPLSETGFISTRMLIPYLSLLGAGANLLQRLKATMAGEEDSSVKLQVATTSQVHSNLGTFPYDDLVTIEV